MKSNYGYAIFRQQKRTSPCGECKEHDVSNTRSRGLGFLVETYDAVAPY